jgi:xylulokinase
MARSVVLGVDSSTQSTKVAVLNLEAGETLRIGRAYHSGESVQDPEEWWNALRLAIADAGVSDVDVRAVSVAAQQHGLVTLDADDNPVRPAPLWNDVAAAPDAERLNAEADFASLAGSRLVASFTIAKLAHLARNSPGDLERTASVALPHDFLTLRLTGNLVTDRGDASGTGWWSPSTGQLLDEAIELAVGPAHARRIKFPRVLAADEPAASVTQAAAAFLGIPAGIPVGAGTGDNMGAALGIGAQAGELVVSLGTSGTAYAVTDHPTSDPTGLVAGFADATDRFLPLTCMLNCTRVVDTTAAAFGLGTKDALDRAAKTEPGAGGLLLLPYFAGERTPNLPTATGELHGVTYGNVDAKHMIRAAVDGVAAGLAYCLEALERLDVRGSRITLVGGGSQHPVWQQAIADASGIPVDVRGGSEHVARGAGIQAAATVREESVRTLAEMWRPAVEASVDPRPEMRDAFQLKRRLDLIARMAGN